MKQEASEVIVKAIKTVLSKQLYASEIIKNRLMMKALRKQEGEDISVSSLTDRELQVFELIGQGFDTREIAEKLRLSVKTVDTYKEHIKDKLNLKNATELIQQASRWELTRQK